MSSLSKRDKSKKMIMMNSYLNEVGKKEIEKREKSVLLGDMSGQFRDVDKFISRNLYSGQRSRRVVGIVKHQMEQTARKDSMPYQNGAFLEQSPPTKTFNIPLKNQGIFSRTLANFSRLD